MSSEPSTLEQPRCAMCSLTCPAPMEPFAPDRVRPAYPADSQGLCVRGHLICDLLNHRLRVYEPCRGGSDGRYRFEMTEALRRTAALGSGGMPLHIWMDGNLTAERLERTIRHARRWRPDATVALYLPPADREAAAGLLASGVRCAEPDQLGEADGYLIFGDPFATHPCLARTMLERRRNRPQMPWIVVDSAAGVTAQFASHHVLVRPGGETAAAAALAAEAGRSAGSAAQPDRETSEQAGLRPDDLARALEAIRGAKRMAVVVAPQLGRAGSWSDTAESLARLAEQIKGLLLVLFVYPHVVEVLQTARSLGWKDLGEAVEAASAADGADLLIVGWDPTSAVPERIWSEALGAARHVVAATSFTGGVAERADVLLPMAMPFEGRDAGGAFFEPPIGVLTPEELFERLAEQASGSWTEQRRPSESYAARPAGEREAPSPGGSERLTAQAVLMAEPVHFDDGSLTRQTSWAEAWGTQPRVLLGPTDAERLGVSDGATVEVHNTCGAARCMAMVRPLQPAGQVALSAAYPQTRAMADWTIGADGALRCGPFKVTLQRI